MTAPKKPYPIPKVHHRYVIGWEILQDPLMRGSRPIHQVAVLSHEQMVGLVSRLISEGANNVHVVHEVLPVD